MYDKDMRYCPVCGDEYRPDFHQCAACRVKLVDGDAMRERARQLEEIQDVPELSEDEPLLPLRKGRLLDIKNLKAALEKAGVPAVVGRGEDCRSGCCGGPEVLLQVRYEDAERAEQVLQQEHERTTGMDVATVDGDIVFDPEAAKAVCPACGHQFSPDGPDCPECGLQFL